MTEIKEEIKWGIKYQAFVKVPYKLQKGDKENEKYGNKEGWVTIEYQRVGTKAVKEKIPKAEQKAIDESMKIIMDKVHEGLEEMEVWFRENMKITMTTKDVEEHATRTREQRNLDVTEKLNKTQKEARD